VRQSPADADALHLRHPEDHAAGNFWADEFDNPEHRIDKIGALERESGRCPYPPYFGCPFSNDGAGHLRLRRAAGHPKARPAVPV
jgi:hypothetical protein